MFSTNKKNELLCFPLCLNPIVFIKQIRIVIGQMNEKNYFRVLSCLQL